MVRKLVFIVLIIIYGTPAFAGLGMRSNSRSSGISPVKRLYSSGSGALAMIDFSVKAVSPISASTNSSVLAVTQNVSSPLAAASSIKLKKAPLNYPNPFRKSDGTTIYYSLDGSFDLDVLLFDMLGNQISKLSLTAGQRGALQGPNKLSLSDFGISGTDLAAGVYFYLFMNNGVVLGKGKMAVIP
ncbi:T9SS C-terminal target domain-containing protein [bacterium]|nr:T9SS C-terminal target domain-containing protein [bacterium]